MKNFFSALHKVLFVILASLINYTACEQNVQTCMKDILEILMLDDDSRGAGHTHRPSIHDTVTCRDYDCVGGFHVDVPRSVLVIHAAPSDCFSLWTAAYTRRTRKAFYYAPRFRAKLREIQRKGSFVSA